MGFRLMLSVALACATAFSSGACGGGTGGLVSCTITESAGANTIELCEEVSGSQTAQASKGCKLSPDAGATGVDASVTLVEGPCSRVGAVGGCRISSAGVTVTDWWYAPGGAGPTTAQIQQLCSSLGVFVAP